MSDKFHIRPFAPEDLSRLHEIRDAAFKPIFQSFREIVGNEIATVAMANAEGEQGELLDDMCADEASHKVLVVDQDGQTVGFCGVKLDEKTKLGEIELIAVHPDCQGGGLGTALNEAAFECMRKAGMKAATVGTAGDPSHAPARRIYEKSGFGPTIPSIWMFRML